MVHPAALHCRGSHAEPSSICMLETFLAEHCCKAPASDLTECKNVPGGYGSLINKEQTHDLHTNKSHIIIYDKNLDCHSFLSEKNQSKFISGIGNEWEWLQ